MGDSVKPWSPPLVELSTGAIGHLLAWELNETEGSWWAWVSWVQSTGNPVWHRHKVVTVRAAGLRPVEAPGAYDEVPRRVRGRDGQIRPWASQQLLSMMVPSAMQPLLARLGTGQRVRRLLRRGFEEPVGERGMADSTVTVPGQVM